MSAAAEGPPTAADLLGSLEYAALQALWQDAPATVGAVLDRINEARPRARRLAYTSVMTVLARLHDKGLVDRAMVGRGYEYDPRFDEQELVRHLGEQAVAGLVERYGDVALVQFAAALQEADPALLARLSRLAEDEE